MSRFPRLAFVLALSPLAACASTTPPAPPAAPPGSPPLGAADASFIETAAEGGMAEIQMAQLAEKTSRNKAVKAFAEHMVRDHSAADDQLKQVATAKGATLPASVSDDQQNTLTRLRGEKGRKFDHDYSASQVTDHAAMLSAFQSEAASGTDPDLKSFASQTIPVIQEHLADAKKLAGPVRRKVIHHHHESSSAS